MNDKTHFLSAARDIIVEDEKLKIMLKEGKISQSTFDDKHKEINERLAQIKEQIADLERKNTALKIPASVERFNDSFAIPHPARDKNRDTGRTESSIYIGVTAAIFGAVIVLCLLLSPIEVYSSLPLSKSYATPKYSVLLYAAALAAQIFMGGRFLLFMARNAGIEGVNYRKARTCAAEAAVITAGFMFLFGLLAAAQEYALIRIILGAAAGILIYFWVTLSLFNTTKQKIVILSVTVYALNYVLAIAVPFSIIILLGLNT